ncbi:MAG: hypothetical protein AABX15_03135 [Thermoproteota archaeon]|mgnify:CR=1 FL=1|nr:hypothetical protein [Nitrosopumilaceae archaeon]
MNYARRSARNWYTAMGVLFIIMALIVLARNIIIWGPGFVLDFLLNSEITNEKVSLGMIVFGSFLIIIGFKKRIPKNS